MPPNAKAPVFSECKRLDFELEMVLFKPYFINY
jgi:hypothetical protein